MILRILLNIKVAHKIRFVNTFKKKIKSSVILVWNEGNERSSHWRCFLKKVFLEISQNSQENTCARVFFNKVPGCFYRTPPGDCFWNERFVCWYTSKNGYLATALLFLLTQILIQWLMSGCVSHYSGSRLIEYRKTTYISPGLSCAQK